jgi:ubiquinone/menaquinone biosynthesis C-methylase UbiE
MGYDSNFINIPLKHDTAFVYTVRKSLQSAINSSMHLFKGTLADLGCGEMPYREYLLDKNKTIKTYIGIDLKNSAYHNKVKPDRYWNGRKIPLKTNSCDTVIATELFEHMSNIEEVLREIRRVLKKDGLLFFTVPFVWPLHETPHDEYRYTPYSLQRHLTNTGFRNIIMRQLGGYEASLAQMLGIWVCYKRSTFNSRIMKKMFGIFEKYIMYPIIKYLLKHDGETGNGNFGENSMPTGFYAYANK